MTDGDGHATCSGSSTPHILVASPRLVTGSWGASGDSGVGIGGCQYVATSLVMAESRVIIASLASVTEISPRRMPATFSTSSSGQYAYLLGEQVAMLLGNCNESARG